MIGPDGLRAIYDAPAGVLAYHGSRGQLVPVAVTPYVLSDDVYITATLAYSQKAQLIRQSPKIALLTADGGKESASASALAGTCASPAPADT